MQAWGCFKLCVPLTWYLLEHLLSSLFFSFTSVYPLLRLFSLFLHFLVSTPTYAPCSLYFPPFLLTSVSRGIKNARKEAKILNPDTGAFLEVDVWYPELKIGFEFQVSLKSEGRTKEKMRRGNKDDIRLILFWQKGRLPLSAHWILPCSSFFREREWWYPFYPFFK